MPQRAIILDTETTGGSARDGDRIIEIGAVETVDFLPTGRIFHAYLDPCVPIHWGATRVHGLVNDDLAGFPRFGDLLPGFHAFMGGARIYAQNAKFARSFVDAEYARCRQVPPPSTQWTCTVPIVKRRSPGGRARLDDVMERLGIQAPDRSTHGALLDAAILAAVLAKLHDAPEVDVSALAGMGKPFPGKPGRAQGWAPRRASAPASTPPPRTPSTPTTPRDRAPTRQPVNDPTPSRTDEARRILSVTAQAYHEAIDILDFVARVEAGGVPVRPNVLERDGQLHGMRFMGDHIYMTTADAGFDGAHFTEGPVAYDQERHLQPLMEVKGRFTREIGRPPDLAHERMSASTFMGSYKVARREDPPVEPDDCPTL